ncbi:hypothetical protein [Amycolatopsis sp. NPDC098790]|uniref:hypothetical protein n=1 Tax=Amycolatopsis sp. NPDC098790 TaxID=3363939 RepID=UPI003825166B
MAFDHQRNVGNLVPLLADGERILTSIPGFFQYDFPDGEFLDEASLVLTTERLLAYRKKLLTSWLAKVPIGRVTNIDMMPMIMMLSGIELPIGVILVGFTGTEWKNWSVKLTAKEKDAGAEFVRQVRHAFPRVGGLPQVDE